MKRILIVLLVIVSVALVFVVSRSMTFKPMDDRSKILEWKFPLPRTHTGVLIGNGVQGLMVWGKGNQLNITVGRAGFWDHRGGHKFKTNTTFQQVKELLMDYDKKAIKTIFSQPAKKEGYPLRPYQLGGGRIEIIFPAGYELKKASLLLNEGALTIYIANKFNQPSKIEIGQSIFDELAWVKTKKRLLKKADIRLVPSYDHYYVKRQLSKIGVKPPEKWADDDSALVGFIQHLPEDKPLSIAFGVDGEKIKIASYLGDEPRYKITEKINDKSVKRMKRKSDRWWKDYWEDVPWLSLPDKTLQEIYDYGLYKQACCHPPHGIPCSLQGPFNEEYQLPPWSNDYHFNINIEMIYWPVLATNRMEHLNPLWDMLMDWMPVMKQNGKKFYGVDDAILMPHAVDDQCQVVGTFWTGMIDQACAAWMSQLAWLHYWYTMDEEILRDIAFPLMKGAFGGYYAMAEKMPDGSLSLPVTVSPEF